MGSRQCGAEGNEVCGKEDQAGNGGDEAVYSEAAEEFLVPGFLGDGFRDELEYHGYHFDDLEGLCSCRCGQSADNSKQNVQRGRNEA